MEDEILKQKYRYLRNRLYTIRNKMNSLIEIHDTTYNNLTEFILIDNKILEEEKFNELKQTEKNIKDEMSNTIIPRINNKI